jgi:hypothetical protein
MTRCVGSICFLCELSRTSSHALFFFHEQYIILTSACSYNVFILEVVGLDLKHDLRKIFGIDLRHDLGNDPASKPWCTAPPLSPYLHAYTRRTQKTASTTSPSSTMNDEHITITTTNTQRLRIFRVLSFDRSTHVTVTFTPSEVRLKIHCLWALGPRFCPGSTNTWPYLWPSLLSISTSIISVDRALLVVSEVPSNRTSATGSAIPNFAILTVGPCPFPCLTSTFGWSPLFSYGMTCLSQVWVSSWVSHDLGSGPGNVLGHDLGPPRILFLLYFSFVIDIPVTVL